MTQDTDRVILIGEAQTDGPLPVMLRALVLSRGDHSRVSVLRDGTFRADGIDEWVGIDQPRAGSEVILRTWDNEGPRPDGWSYFEGSRVAWPRDLMLVRIDAEVTR